LKKHKDINKIGRTSEKKYKKTIFRNWNFVTSRGDQEKWAKKTGDGKTKLILGFTQTEINGPALHST
jgi:hypothetical protein